MTLISLIFRECVWMFIDDEFRAFAILAVVGRAAACAYLFMLAQILVGSMLAGGCIGVRVSSALRARGAGK